MNKYLVLLLVAALAFASCKANSNAAPSMEITDVIMTEEPVDGMMATDEIPADELMPVETIIE